MILVRNESFKQYLLQYPVSSIIVLLNTIMFIFTSLIGGLTNPIILYEFGGISSEYIQKGEYYRLISSGFIHNGFMHFIFNMGYIAITAPPIEKMLKKHWYLLLFVLTILGASLFTVLFNGDRAVGASGFGYGILGFYLAIIIWNKELIDKESRSVLIFLISVGWVLTIAVEQISFLGHLGGFVVGVFFGLLVVTMNRNRKLKRYVTARIKRRDRFNRIEGRKIF